VGFGKPPVETRFRKGTLCNPHGPPKVAKNKTPEIEELRRKNSPTQTEMIRK
jgi:hypothetical protein